MKNENFKLKINRKDEYCEKHNSPKRKYNKKEKGNVNKTKKIRFLS